MAKLSKSAVEQAKIKDRDYFLWDDEIKGFGCNILASGEKRTYYFLYYSPTTKKKAKIKIGCHGNVTVDFARKKALEFSHLVASGIDPRDKKKQEIIQEKKSILLKDFFPIYMERHAQHHNEPNTLRANRQQFKNHLQPFFGDKKLDSITRQDVFEFKNRLSSRKTTFNRSFILLKAMFNKAILWGYLTQTINPCEGVDKYPEIARETFLTDKQIARIKGILASYETSTDVGKYVIGAIELLLYTGCRRNEVLKLKWSNVQLDQDCIHFKKAKIGEKETKTDEKIVPLNALSKAVIERMERRPNNPYVFCGKKPGSHLVGLNPIWGNILKQLEKEEGLMAKRFRVHDLRHTFASVAIKSGLGLYQVSKLLGHRNVQTTTRYAHIGKEELVKNAKLMESVFG